MPKRRFQLAHYYGIVAAVYFLVFLTIGLVLSGAPMANIPAQMWLLPFVGAAMGCFITFACILRFGDIGGSIYFTSTALHITVILGIVWVTVLGRI